jgi:hypothetical protein
MFDNQNYKTQEWELNSKNNQSCENPFKNWHILKQKKQYYLLNSKLVTERHGLYPMRAFETNVK